MKLETHNEMTTTTKATRKRAKYLVGCVAMAACWLVGAHYLTAGESPAKYQSEIESRECAISKVQSELELPSEYETIGIDLLLFEPLPEPRKTTRKARNEKQKAKNKS